ncbi:SurA N-terminal domain-containing protein [Brachyspira pilosicoli]|uniref:SurA N-terminal domain-containing protein n=1 Tax=Brachyspira pilosicoli TaxID=52584 RepID=UPI0024911763|nr:SurA N-terminal domain-containing protein [Brachyspira pilosicoli]
MYIKKVFLSLIVLSIFFVSCSNTKTTNSSDSLAYLQGGEGEWVLKVDDFTINQTNFNKDYKVFLNSMKAQGVTPEQIAMIESDNRYKQNYAEDLINQILLLEKAETDKFFETEEAKSTIDATIRNIKAQYYYQKLIEQAASNVPAPTPEQAKAFFDQAKDQLQLAQYGITEYNTQTAPYIADIYKRVYAEQNVQREIIDLKDKAVIERNNAVLGEPTIVPPTAMPNTQGQVTNNLLPRATN